MKSQIFRLICVGILLGAAMTCSAQISNKEGLDEATQEKLENIAATTDEELDFTTLLDKLAFYANNPLDLNTASRRDLEDIVLLNDLQINNLQEHIRVDGPLIALEELQTIDGFDALTIQSLLRYVKVGSGNPLSGMAFRKIVKDGKNTLFLRTQAVAEEAKGFSQKNPETNDTSRYLGSRLKLYARYRFVYGNRISIGLTGEKDAGEEFFKGTQKQGFDFYSAHFFYRGDGLVQKILLGDFQAQYGQGLVLWSGLAYGKSSDVLNVRKAARGLLPYTSVDENLFLRGGGVSLGHKNFQADFFASSKYIDANLANSVDTLEQEDIVSSFQEAGYHRTYAELHDKHSLKQDMFGGHFQYTGSRWEVGFTACQTEFDRPLLKDGSLYSQYDFQGDHNNNLGLDYSFNYRNISFFGEAGRSMNGGTAFINGILLSLDPRLAVSVVNRNYSRDYQALVSHGLAESSETQNERGTYFSVSARLSPVVTLNTYIDYFKFPWLRYQVDAPSHGYEYLAQLSYVPSKTFEAYVRIKYQTKEENGSGDLYMDPLVNVNQSNYRVNVRYKVSPSVVLSNRLEIVNYRKGNAATDQGFLVYQDVSWKVQRFTWSLRYALFDSETYDSRIYAYENDVLYAYSIPSYYYKGSRFYALVRIALARGVDLWLRAARTVYSNQDTIGSGLDEIQGNHKTEYKAQLRLQF